MKIIIGNTSRAVGELVACNLNVQRSVVKTSRFPDSEINVEVENNLSNEKVYIVHSTSFPVNDSIMELLLTIDVVKRMGPEDITTIIPYYGYSRHDRVIENNGMLSALNAKLIANLIEAAGVNKVAVIEFHVSQLEGFFNIPVVNLSCLELFTDFIQTKGFIQTQDLVIIAPDVGAIKRAREFAKILEAKYNMKALSNNIVVIDKYRDKKSVPHVMNVIGEVAGKKCVIVDDIIDSGSTLCNAASELKNRGARSVIACIAHGVLSGNATEKINLSELDRLIITDTIPLKSGKVDKIDVVSIANIITDFIRRR
jgi:ribose-phosphate pyrophosphokinase